MIIDSVAYVNDAYKQGKNIITEGANAHMLDMDFGTYPYVTSSTTTVGGICTGLGLSPDKIECAMGVVKAYTTRVGWGPFPTELTDSTCGGMRPDGSEGTDIGRHLQVTGGEIGVTTKRKRRCGWLDIPVVQYGNLLNGYSNNGSINITKLDVMDDLKEIRILNTQLPADHTLFVPPIPLVPSPQFLTLILTCSDDSKESKSDNHSIYVDTLS